MLGEIFERPPERFLPYAGHIAPSVVLMMDNTVLGMVEFTGVATELESNSTRNGRELLLNNLLKNLADDTISSATYCVKYEAGPEDLPPVEEAISAHAADLMAGYRAKVVLPGLRKVRWFCAVMVRQRVQAKRQWARVKKSFPSLSINADAVERLEGAMFTITNRLHEYGPRQLGQRTVGGVVFSEIAETLHLIRTATWRPIPVPSGPLGSVLYVDRVRCGWFAVDLGLPGRDWFARMLSFREYPSCTSPGMFNGLLQANYSFVLAQSFYFINRGRAETSLALKQRQMLTAGDRAVSQQEGLTEAMDDIASGEVATGVHNLSLAVFAPKISALGEIVADASGRMTAAGAVMVREWLGQEAAYWSQMPGSTEFRTRPGKISTRNFAGMSSFETAPRGQMTGPWGSAPAVFRTRAGTPYAWVPHVANVPHTMLVGRTGSGKTALMGFLLGALESAVGPTGVRILVDKDSGNKIMVEASGGRYLHFRRGQESGIAPLFLSDNPSTRSFLHSLFRGLIERDGNGTITADEDARLGRAIRRQMKLPADLRSMGGIREFLGFSEGSAGERFERWCAGGSMGWLLDNREHRVRMDLRETHLFGFDLTELLPRDGIDDDGACEVAAAVIAHQMQGLMDGRRIVAFFDECRFYLRPLAALLEDYALTGRKKELMLVLAAQQPEHFTDVPIGRSLVSQCFTKIVFPDVSGHEADYVKGLKLSPAAFKQVREGMTDGAARRFLLWRNEESAICEFDLSALPEDLVFLSGKPATVSLWDATREEIRRAAAEFRRRISA